MTSVKPQGHEVAEVEVTVGSAVQYRESDRKESEAKSEKQERNYLSRFCACLVLRSCYHGASDAACRCRLPQICCFTVF